VLRPEHEGRELRQAPAMQALTTIQGLDAFSIPLEQKAFYNGSWSSPPLIYSKVVTLVASVHGWLASKQVDVCLR
jgi:hypothetical protein